METWSWKRFFNGFISGQRYGKDLAILTRITILAVLGLLIAYGGITVFNKIFGGSKAEQRTVGTINSGGAPVDNSTKKSFWSLFYFGGQNQ